MTATSVCYLFVGYGGDVKMCESESKNSFDDLDDLPRRPFVRVSFNNKVKVTLKPGCIEKHHFKFKSGHFNIHWKNLDQTS